MNRKLLFIVMNGEIKFLNNPAMDHREWYQSLGGSMDDYDNVIRGYVMDGKIIYFKSDLKYDDEVIAFAIKTGLKMKEQLKDMNLKVCCGIDPGHDDVKWEPILVLKDEDLEGYQAKQHENIEQPQQQMMSPNPIPDGQSMVEFKNDASDPKFIKTATKFTLIMLALAFFSKLLLIPGQTMMMSNRWNALLIITQFGGLILSLVGYKLKLSKTKIFAFVASIASIFMFNFFDILVGILTALFTVDYMMVLYLWDMVINLYKKVRQWIKNKSSQNNSNHKTN